MFESAKMRGRWLAMAVLSCGSPGCGGGAPLLHPAHALPFGRISAGAGVSGQFALGTRTGAEVEPRSGGQAEQRAFEDAAARAALSPGVAPWASARAGLGDHFEGGLTYTGRTVRADARHAFSDDSIALSIGAGASAVFARSPDRDGPAPPMGRVPATGPDARASGYGFDVPVVFGWRSTASIVEGWIGARGGVEHLDGTLPLEPPDEGPRAGASLTATRWYGGGLVGAAVGLSPIMVAVELDVAYQSVSATASFPGPAGPPSRREGTATGLTLAPAGAIVGKF